MQESQIRVALCRRALLAYAVAVNNRYEPNWHHGLIASKLEAVERGEVRRLMIFAPPQHGKSELTTALFPAWYQGRHADKHLITASYNQALANDWGHKVRAYCLSSIHRQVFGESIVITGRGLAQNRWRLRDGGSYRAVGIGVGITGRPADGIIIDDPIKSRKEANSLTYRNAVWNWYVNEVYTRLSKTGFIVLILTRWHEDDLAGRLLMQAKEQGERWEVITLPALAETEDGWRKPGDALWPERHPREKLLMAKRVLGDRIFESLYQQRPSIMQGNIIKVDRIRYYPTVPERFQRLLQSWDLSFKDADGSSFVVGQVWGQVGENFWLIDTVRRQMGLLDTIRAIKAMVERYPGASRLLIEDKANGPAVMEVLAKQLHGVAITPVQPRGTKEERAEAIADLFDAGRVCLPDKASCPWVSSVVEEWANFPNAPNDDQVDAMTQALAYMTRYRDVFLARGASEALPGWVNTGDNWTTVRDRIDADIGI